MLALAIGLASKDIISGIFILLDKPFKIGSIIEVRGVKGEVIEIGLRVTKIKTEEGAIATIPNTILSSDIVKKERTSETLLDHVHLCQALRQICIGDEIQSIFCQGLLLRLLVQLQLQRDLAFPEVRLKPGIGEQ